MLWRQGNLDSVGQTEALPETTPPSDCGFLGVENLRIAYKNFKDGISDRVKDGDDLFCLSWLSPILCNPLFSRQVYIIIPAPYREAQMKGVDRRVDRTSGMHSHPPAGRAGTPTRGERRTAVGRTGADISTWLRESFVGSAR